MTLPAAFAETLSLPLIAAPMFLVSGPDLVTETCRHGVVGSFPSLNARPAAQLDEWLDLIAGRLAAAAATGPKPAPFAVNLIVHPTNPRLADDLALCESHRVPVVITSVGGPRRVASRIQAYGGLVFHDVTNAAHARKAAEAGVDGIILVAAGAGGHAGTTSPFALVDEVCSFWDGPLVLAGAMSDGAAIRAAEVMGADLAYMGARFVATAEAQAHADYKSMLIDSAAEDLVYTDAFSGVRANILRQSIVRAGLDPNALMAKERPDMSSYSGDGAVKAWRDIWSAGHGVGAIQDVVPVGELIRRLREEYDRAAALAAWPRVRGKPVAAEPAVSRGSDRPLYRRLERPGSVPMCLQMTDSITSSAPPPIEVRRWSR